MYISMQIPTERNESRGEKKKEQQKESGEGNQKSSGNWGDRIKLWDEENH